jgi:hypothetical protein
MALAEIPFGPESCAMATVAKSASAERATKERMDIPRLVGWCCRRADYAKAQRRSQSYFESSTATTSGHDDGEAMAMRKSDDSKRVPDAVQRKCEARSGAPLSRDP